MRCKSIKKSIKTATKDNFYLKSYQIDNVINIKNMFKQKKLAINIASVFLILLKRTN